MRPNCPAVSPSRDLHGQGARRGDDLHEQAADPGSGDERDRLGRLQAAVRHVQPLLRHHRRQVRLVADLVEHGAAPEQQGQRHEQLEPERAEQDQDHEREQHDRATDLGRDKERSAAHPVE
jgi:hypothetical protein